MDRALAGRSLPDDFADGTFTITNLGGLDVDGFTPIINPPQAAILGVGRIVEKPVARDGAVVVRPMMTLSLSFDHRIVDGAPGRSSCSGSSSWWSGRWRCCCVMRET